MAIVSHSAAICKSTEEKRLKIRAPNMVPQGLVWTSGTEVATLIDFSCCVFVTVDFLIVSANWGI